MPIKSAWCENYPEFAFTQVGGHAVEEHSPGTLLAEQAPGALTADPDLVAVASPRYRYLLIHCILCEQRCQQSSASVSLCNPAGPPDGSPGVAPKAVRFGFAQHHSASSAQQRALPPPPPSLLVVVRCFPGCTVEMGHVAFGL